MRITLFNPSLLIVHSKVINVITHWVFTGLCCGADSVASSAAQLLRPLLSSLLPLYYESIVVIVVVSVFRRQ
jgi:hypothetical protein